MSAAAHELGAPGPSVAVVPGPAPSPAPSLAQLLRHRGPDVGTLREPTFDELVTGSGRHRDAHALDVSSSLLRRVALRARLLPTPARRPASRASGAL